MRGTVGGLYFLCARRLTVASTVGLQTAAVWIAECGLHLSRCPQFGLGPAVIFHFVWTENYWTTASQVQDTRG